TPAEAGDEWAVAADAGDQEVDGRSAQRTVGRRGDRRSTGGRAQAGRAGEEAGPVRLRSGHAEIYAGDPGAARGDGCDRRYDDRDLRHGIGRAARAEDGRAKR